MPMDLKRFAEDSSLQWGLRELISILCQVMHGIRLFHHLKYVLTDLKTANVLVNPHTGNVRLIDFTESYDQEAHEELKRKKEVRHNGQSPNGTSNSASPPRVSLANRSTSYMHSYLNRGQRITQQEDVWRLGLLLVECLLPYSNRIRSRRNQETIDGHFLMTMRNAIKKETHPSATTTPVCWSPKSNRCGRRFCKISEHNILQTALRTPLRTPLLTPPWCTNGPGCSDCLWKWWTNPRTNDRPYKRYSRTTCSVTSVLCRGLRIGRIFRWFQKRRRNHLYT